MQKDRNSTPRGYVGKLDFDPICNCQDANGLQLAGLAVTNVDATHASALATLKFPSEPLPRIVQFFLLRTAVGWRIDDIKTSDIPSLRKFLQPGH